ncbi:hypothetical protein ACFVMC_13085 [Nocardia sp. NPDC127579]|uniref:hypothetical protein n=1 Tax=Nocardia sp. NPDC127579 TaxID=3345402 RepID=UPI003641EE32
MNDRMAPARDDLEHRLRRALTGHPSFVVRQVGRREVRVARPHDYRLESTPYRFSLFLDVSGRRVETVEHWSVDGDLPLRRDRDREQPVRDLIAAELARAGWRPGRGPLGSVSAVASKLAWYVCFSVIAVLMIVYFYR